MLRQCSRRRGHCWHAMILSFSCWSGSIANQAVGAAADLSHRCRLVRSARRWSGQQRSVFCRKKEPGRVLRLTLHRPLRSRTQLFAPRQPPCNDLKSELGVRGDCRWRARPGPGRGELRPRGPVEIAGRRYPGPLLWLVGWPEETLYHPLPVRRPEQGFPGLPRHRRGDGKQRARL
jgi:hypothetical protein